MRLKLFIGSTLFGLLVVSAVPAFAQGEPPGRGSAQPDGAQEPQPATPSSNDPATPAQGASSEAPAAPADHRVQGAAPAADGSVPPDNTMDEVPPGDDDVDVGPIKIGETLSPLVITAGLGYAYASVNHPDLVSHSLSGAFLEVTAGTELDRRFRLALAFTSFETKLRRAPGGKWREGDYAPTVASSGLHTAADPVTPSEPNSGGVEVQKTFHAHSIGPRMDFLPLGSQGPYLGMTAGVGVIQDVSSRVGLDLAARIGGEWRPFHSLGLAVEAGAHGQIYDDSKAAIPYALARLTLMLEPPGMHKKGSAAPSSNKMFMPLTPPPPSR